MRKLIFLLLLSALAHATNWQPYAQGLWRTGDFKNGAGGGVFVPVRQNDCSLSFFQLEGGYFRRNWVGSGGVGYRTFSSSCTAWGVNGFVDIARKLDGYVYQQFGLGAEYFTKCMTFRLNGYIPSTYGPHFAGDKSEFAIINGMPAEVIFPRDTHAYIGFDLSGGYGIDVGCGQVWGYLGYFLYDSQDVVLVTGPRARIEYKLCDLFCPGTELFVAGHYEWSRDRGHSVAGSLEVRLPLYLIGNQCKACLGPCCVGNLKRRMNERVRREQSIWIDWPKFRLPRIIM